MVDGAYAQRACYDGPSANPSVSATSSRHLAALHTKAEVDARVVDNALAATDRAGFAHLRRVVRKENLPLNLQNKYAVATSKSCGAQEQACGIGASRTLVAKEEPSYFSKTLHLCLLLCVKSSMPHEAVSALLQESAIFDRYDLKPNVFTITVPVSSPSSAEEAHQWSRDYWPAVYKKHNPLGPQHSSIDQAAQEISADVQQFMALAERVGFDACDQGIGEKVGALIVNRSDHNAPSVIVAAGDARWKGISAPKKPGNGNAMAHAVMRAIDLVSQKRKACSAESNISGQEVQQSGVFTFTASEKEIYDQSSLVPGGYLCLDFELYVTHEPCVMCCMAMLHSRFSKVIFGYRMPRTGALVAEAYEHEGIDGLGYGLFWRPSLNWKFLAWQWDEKGEPGRRRYYKLSKAVEWVAVVLERVESMFEPHGSDDYRLRAHRARSVILTDEELVEIRAAQRTFEGAYIRTALGQFSFSLVILKIFTSEFYSIGALFAVYGAGILLLSLFRRQQGNKQFFSEIGEDGLNQRKFRTSGNVVVVLTALSIAAYSCLLILTLRLADR
ncbi:uncharacterized protein KY384_000247 [Bacidia gigantensis]|uniref:uncharacterized protein n=1 Tax=Bacidia gigantensis TaxID=2732470 RepID=UPI001D039493|nr:uncharacterized protein KY384_000247 [Bacidia gigantensis]KAG8526254.1 hypothetical protein KY384_000247 [Bacidia gigantensis]